MRMASVRVTVMWDVCTVDTLIIPGVQNWGRNAKALFLNNIALFPEPVDITVCAF